MADNFNYADGNSISRKDDLLKAKINNTFSKGYEKLNSKIHLLMFSSNTIKKGNLGTNRLRQEANSVSKQSGAIFQDFQQIREDFNAAPKTKESVQRYGSYLQIFKALLSTDIMKDTESLHVNEIVDELKKWKMIE